MYSELRAQSTRNTQQYDSTIQYKFQVLVDVLILVGNRYWSTVHIVHCLYSGVLEYKILQDLEQRATPQKGRSEPCVRYKDEY